MYEDEDNPAVALIRFFIALNWCEEDMIQELLKAIKGKYVDELDIPLSQLEKNFLDEREYDEDFEDDVVLMLTFFFLLTGASTYSIPYLQRRLPQ